MASAVPTSVAQTLSHPNPPPANMIADAPAGGCNTPNRAVKATANAGAKLRRHHTGSAVAYEKAKPMGSDRACPSSALRGCEAGAIVKPYSNVTMAPKGLRDKVG